jgi:hypothetical protein
MEARSIEERLNRLERQNRRLRVMLLAVIVIAGGGVLLSSVSGVRAQAPAWRRTVEAEKFVLRDANGKTRAVLGTAKSKAFLDLNESSGKLGAELSTTIVGPDLLQPQRGARRRADWARNRIKLHPFHP